MSTLTLHNMTINRRIRSVRNHSVLVSVGILILLGILVVGTMGIHMYQIYTTSTTIQKALELARIENRQISIDINTGAKANINVTNYSSLSVVGENNYIVKIIVYPRNTYTQYIRLPDGTYIYPY